MKKIICLALAAVLCMSVMLVGCTGSYDKSPAEYTGVRWIAPDYSIRFTPDDGGKGTYYFNEKKYNVRFDFDGDSFTVYDTDKNDTRLFEGDWTYEENERLYLFNISFNKNDYKEMKENYMEFITLRTEQIEKKK